MSDTAFWNKIAQKYAASPIEDVPAYEASLKRVFARLSPNDHVLELGCGTGSTALRLSEYAAKITATDFSAEMIRIAKSKQSDTQFTNVDFQVVDAQSPSDGLTYDVVCAFNLVHLLPDFDAGMQHIKSQIKPGGLFISKTPCLGEMSRFMPVVIWLMQRVGKAPFVSNFTITQLEAKLRDAGFELIESETYGKAGRSRFIVARPL